MNTHLIRWYHINESVRNIYSNIYLVGFAGITEPVRNEFAGRTPTTRGLGDATRSRKVLVEHFACGLATCGKPGERVTAMGVLADALEAHRSSAVIWRSGLGIAVDLP